VSEKFDPSVWAGTKWRCNITGEVLVIPDDVKEGQFFEFGMSFIDVGDGYYSRMGGAPVFIDEPEQRPYLKQE